MFDAVVVSHFIVTVAALVIFVVMVPVVDVVDDQQLELLLLGSSLEMRIKHLLRNQRFLSKKKPRWRFILAKKSSPVKTEPNR